MPDDPDSKNPFRSPDAPEPKPQASKQDKYFSVDHEPALQGGDFAVDPSEQRAAGTGQPPEEHESLRDSIAMEPALPQHADPQPWRDWLQQKRDRCTRAGNLAVTLTAALLGGPLAIVGAFALGMQGYAQAVYMVVFGPVIEELLKQSGMVSTLR